MVNRALIQDDPDTAKLLEALDILKGEEASRRDQLIAKKRAAQEAKILEDQKELKLNAEKQMQEQLKALQEKAQVEIQDKFKQ